MKPTINSQFVDVNQGNIFEILGAVRYALRKNKQYDDAKEVTERVLASASYEEAKQICFEYVEVV